MGLFESKAIGRLTKDPELKYVQVKGKDTAVCEFSVAVNYGYGDNEKTEFIDCVAWRGLGETIAKHLKKGRKVYVAGHQQTRKYDREVGGQTITMRKTEWILDDFEFCDSNSGGQGNSQGTNQSQGYSATPVNDDDVPF
jgi:single-strand DNA-binding protein